MLGARLSVTLVAGVMAGQMMIRAQVPQVPQAPLPPLEFEVASVKINTSGDTQTRLNIPPGAGRVDVVNMPLRGLIQAAYTVPANQLDAVPAWVNNTRIDIVAKADPSASVQQLRAMLQPLLVERFKLAFHHEQRERDVYGLVVAKPGTLGPNLKPGVDCAARADLPRNTLPTPAAGQPQECGIIPAGPGRIVAKGLRLNGFVALLSLATGALGARQVIDQTGLTGGYDIALTYTPEALSATALAQRQGGAPALAAGVDPNGPNLFQALQDQLGLKLESRKIPLDIMVIDRIEPPVPD
jgi:uncharacterized protein (TIGR03435 family)